MKNKINKKIKKKPVKYLDLTKNRPKQKDKPFDVGIVKLGNNPLQNFTIIGIVLSFLTLASFVVSGFNQNLLILVPLVWLIFFLSTEKDLILKDLDSKIIPLILVLGIIGFGFWGLFNFVTFQKLLYVIIKAIIIIILGIIGFFFYCLLMDN